MPDPSRFTLQYRNPQLIDHLLRRALTGEERLDQAAEWAEEFLTKTDGTPFSGATLRNTIDELIDHGLIRTLRNRQGHIQAHRTTKAGLAYLQGRTTWPQPHHDQDADTWEWFAPTPSDLTTDHHGGLLFAHPDDYDDLEPYLDEDLLITDDGSPDLDDLETPPPPLSTPPPWTTHPDTPGHKITDTPPDTQAHPL